MAERWVVQLNGPHAGRIGLVERSGSRWVIVQFGSAGPYVRIGRAGLRKASREEVAEANGCRPRDLPTDLAISHPSQEQLAF